MLLCWLGVFSRTLTVVTLITIGWYRLNLLMWMMLFAVVPTTMLKITFGRYQGYLLMLRMWTVNTETIAVMMINRWNCRGALPVQLVVYRRTIKSLLTMVSVITDG